LDAGAQALLVLARLRNGDTYARLARGFGIGTTTAWWYVREAVDLLAVVDNLYAVTARADRLAYAILDGTLIPIDRSPIRGRTTRESTSATALTCRC
jgi:hypothetical protein